MLAFWTLTARLRTSSAAGKSSSSEEEGSDDSGERAVDDDPGDDDDEDEDEEEVFNRRETGEIGPPAEVDGIGAAHIGSSGDGFIVDCCV